MKAQGNRHKKRVDWLPLLWAPIWAFVAGIGDQAPPVWALVLLSASGMWLLCNVEAIDSKPQNMEGN